MDNKLKIITVFFLCSFLLSVRKPNTVLAQNTKIDSLQILIKSDKTDTNKVNHLNKLSRTYFDIGNYDSALHFASQALELSKILIDEKGGSWDKGIASANGNLGNAYLKQSNYPLAIDHYLQAIKTDEKIKDKNGLAKRLGNIGIVYKKQGDYPSALDYYLKAQRIYEELELKTDIAANLINIGNVYRELGDYSKALDYSFKAQKLYEDLGLKIHAAKNMSNIGGVYFKQKNYSKASEYISGALKMAEDNGDTIDIARQLGNMGNIYTEQANSFSTDSEEQQTARKELFSKALNYHFMALKLREKLGAKSLVASTLASIGSIYTSLKKYDLACDYVYKSLSIYVLIGEKNEVKDRYKDLSYLYEKSHTPLSDGIGGKVLSVEQMRLKALYFYKQYTALNDTLFSEENKMQLVQKEMNYEFGKKEAITKAETEKKQAIADTTNRNQRIIIWTVSIGLFLLLLFSGFIFRSLRITGKQKKLIEIKNRETELQKKIIEEKNKDITDSINYAKRIQDALLREEEHVSHHLPEHFILYLPKDIVSGDFYWGNEKQDYWYFAAADCTGHGVPGAVMSMLGISFLNDIISVEQLLTPAEILNLLRDRMVKELRQTGETNGNKDGMDISLCRLNVRTLKLQWAGANNPLSLLRNGELEKIKADKQPIGYHPESKTFTNHEVQLNKGDCVYIYSDGYADQFGGPQEKKMGYKKLENLFVIHNFRPMREQKDIFKKRFAEWKGELEQIDDVCIFGVRV